MSSKDTKGVPVPGGVKAKSSTFSKQDVVLMILAGIYHGGKASSMRKMIVIAQQQDQVEEGSDFGSGHADECVENIRSGSRKNLCSSDLRMAESHILSSSSHIR
eukprot:scaffold2689_cov70-Skeletonema_marinoi.AAC.2